MAVGGVYAFRYTRTQVPDDRIVASGSIEADETTIAPKVAGRLLKLLVDEGDEVKKGQLLATLDDAELKDQLGQAEAALYAAQARLDEAVNGNRPEQIAQAAAQLSAAESSAVGSRRALSVANRNIRHVLDLQTEVDAANSRLAVANAAFEQATAALALLRKGSRPKQIDEARAALEQANIAFAKSEIDYSRTKTLVDEGALAGQKLDDIQATRDSAQKQVEQAQAHLNDLVAGPRPEELREAEFAVAQASANVEGAQEALNDARQMYREHLAAQTELDSSSASSQTAVAQVAAARAALDLMKSGTRPEEVQNARATRDQAAKAVAYAKSMVGDTLLYSPTDGVVKSKDALPGETLNPGGSVVTVADLDHVWLRIYVPEDRYGALRLGQPVQVKVDSFPKEVFPGKIVAINSDAEFTPKNAQTPEERVKLVFGVKIALQNTGRRLKPGMPGDATILTR